MIGFGALPWQFWPLLVAIVAAYLTLVELIKIWFDRREARRPDAIARRNARAGGGGTTTASGVTS